MSRTSTLPERLQPMLATLTDARFDATGWVFEDKYDGFRMIAEIRRGKVALYSRNGNIISHSYIEVSKSSFPAKVKDEAVTTWIRPSLVAEVKFAEWTSKGELHQPVYLGLRSYKRAKDVMRERDRPRK